MNLRLDGAIDRALARVIKKPPMFTSGAHDPSSSIAVVGFPRSANTLLTVWLSSVVRPGVTVIDGRDSHSTLDLHRISDAGIPVIIPVREPIAACASMMVRKGRHGSERYGVQILRAYVAWHSVAGRLLDRDAVRVAPFATVTTDPASLAHGDPFAQLVDADVAATLDQETLVERTRTSIAGVVGQGLPEGGIAAHLMISLPEPARADELAQAKAILRSRKLSEARLNAELACEDFVSAAELAQPAHFAALGSDVDTRASAATR